MQVREFIDGCDVAQPLVVRQVEVRQRRDGGEYLKLSLGDRTGSVVAMVWEEVREARDLCSAGEIVHVSGRYSVHPRHGPQLALQALRNAAEGEYDVDELLDGPPRSLDQMETDLRGLLATIQNPHLRRLLAIVFREGSPTWAAYREAPAAKYYHQAYR
ncbi:MAG TPA: OB-fold nucleic acid binding domain-containing protein, partial [Solirubrobacteraceae bacterium]|nr:OB-fold nucleic acid binding domain-containing protein [Solirubrobacteraceae bacterium]